MIAILSPARTIRPGYLEGLEVTSPTFLAQATQLAGILRRFSPWELEATLRANPELALRAFHAYQIFEPAAAGSPALLSYHGLVYQHLAPGDFTREDLMYANSHLRLLSAFYGLLRPTDGIQPYRLELTSRLKVDGRSLYAFWGKQVYQELYQVRQPVVNLCSGEYSKVITPYLHAKDAFITCKFLIERGGRLRCITTSAKAARGQMARFIIKNRLESPADLSLFEWEGYQFVPKLSSESEYIFVQAGW